MNEKELKWRPQKKQTQFSYWIWWICFCSFVVVAYESKSESWFMLVFSQRKRAQVISILFSPQSTTTNPLINYSLFSWRNPNIHFTLSRNSERLPRTVGSRKLSMCTYRGHTCRMAHIRPSTQLNERKKIYGFPFGRTSPATPPPPPMMMMTMMIAMKLYPVTSYD